MQYVSGRLVGDSNRVTLHAGENILGRAAGTLLPLPGPAIHQGEILLTEFLSRSRRQAASARHSSQTTSPLWMHMQGELRTPGGDDSTTDAAAQAALKGAH